MADDERLTEIILEESGDKTYNLPALFYGCIMVALCLVWVGVMVLGLYWLVSG